MVVVKGQTAQKAWAKDTGLEYACLDIDRSQLAGAGIEHPEFIRAPAWRVWHREPVRNDLVGHDIDNATAFGAASSNCFPLAFEVQRIPGFAWCIPDLVETIPRKPVRT